MHGDQLSSKNIFLHTDSETNPVSDSLMTSLFGSSINQYIKVTCGSPENCQNIKYMGSPKTNSASKIRPCGVRRQKKIACTGEFMRSKPFFEKRKPHTRDYGCGPVVLKNLLFAGGFSFNVQEAQMMTNSFVLLKKFANLENVVAGTASDHHNMLTSPSMSGVSTWEFKRAFQVTWL